ncbi:hypothetical protein ACA910_005279 [Epithemia clementina (nom. ined.)]
MWIIGFLLVVAAVNPISAKVTRPFQATTSRSRKSRYRDSVSYDRRLDDAGAGKGGKGGDVGVGKKTGSDSPQVPGDGEDFEPLRTIVPTVSSPPSFSVRPSSLPTVTPRPTLSTETSSLPPSTPPTPVSSSFPSSPPSLSPTPEPPKYPSSQQSANPSGQPSSSTLSGQPSSAPSNTPTNSSSSTFTPPPTANSTRSSPSESQDDLVVSQSGSILEYSCPTMVKPEEYGPEVQQLFEAGAHVCLSNDPPPALETLPSNLLSTEIIPRLAELEVHCKLDQNIEIVAIILDTNKAGQLVFESNKGNGISCFVWNFNFQCNYFEDQSRRRAAVNPQITNSELLEQIHLAMVGIFQEVLPDSNFTGFRNVNGAVVASAPSPAPVKGNEAGLLNESDPSSSSSSIGAAPILVIVCSVMLLLVVAALAVRRRQAKDRNMAASHVLLKEDDDNEQRTDGSLGKTSASTAAILKDLDPDENLDDEEKTTGGETVDVSHIPYPQVYVMDGNDAETALDEEEELRFTSGAYWVRGQTPSQGPTFVTTDLKKAMKDLEPPPPTPKSQRGYVQEDTVDL